MQWEVLVPIIVMAVFILINVFRTNDETQRDARRRAQGAAPPNRPPSEVERFLEEINKLKQRAEEKKRAAGEDTPRAAPPVVMPTPTPAPRIEAPVRPRPPRPVVTPPPRRPLPESPRVRPPLEVVATPVAPPPPPLTPAPPPVPVVPAVVASVPVLSPPPAPMVTTVPEKLSPAAAQLRALLRSPQTLRVAVLLHEVLGPPRCKRR